VGLGCQVELASPVGLIILVCLVSVPLVPGTARRSGATHPAYWAGIKSTRIVVWQKQDGNRWNGRRHGVLRSGEFRDFVHCST
jgi:hypothetical protein